MNYRELKRAVNNAHPEVHVLSNEGDIYLVQVFCDGEQALLKERDGKPVVFHGLPECLDKLKAVGVHKAYVDQTMAYDEMINSTGDSLSHTDHRLISI